MKRFSVKENDLIISCSGTIGKVVIIEKDFKEGIINQALLKITPNENVIAKYLKLFFDYGINLDNRGSAIKNLVSVEELKNLEVPIPSIEIQEEIVRQYEEEIQYIKMTEKMTSIYFYWTTLLSEHIMIYK
jgi:type I restriction enzyme S subunit